LVVPPAGIPVSLVKNSPATRCGPASAAVIRRDAKLPDFALTASRWAYVFFMPAAGTVALTCG
jgi:hypothetical protein